jgi:hypothetical protein
MRWMMSKKEMMQLEDCKYLERSSPVTRSDHHHPHDQYHKEQRKIRS